MKRIQLSCLTVQGNWLRLNREYIGEDFSLYDKAIPVTKEHELRGSSFQVSSVNDRTATKEEYVKALVYEFTLPLPNGRKWDLDKDIIPVFEKI